MFLQLDFNASIEEVVATVSGTHSKTITDHPGHGFWGISEKVPIGVPIGGPTPTRVTRVIEILGSET